MPLDGGQHPSVQRRLVFGFRKGEELHRTCHTCWKDGREDRERCSDPGRQSETVSLCQGINPSQNFRDTTTFSIYRGCQINSFNP